MQLRQKKGSGGAAGALPALPPEMQLDLQLDLLVDEELPEDVRAALLGRLDSQPGLWRELSIRFMQRQMERRTMRGLMNGEPLVPVDFEAAMRKDEARLYRFPLLRSVTTGRMIGVAAGLLLAVTSALITLQVMQRPTSVRPPTLGGTDMVQASLPGQSMGMETSLAVNVPVVAQARPDGQAWQFLSSDKPVTRRSVVIQQDGAGNALVIPVNTMHVHVY